MQPNRIKICNGNGDPQGKKPGGVEIHIKNGSAQVKNGEKQRSCEINQVKDGVEAPFNTGVSEFDGDMAGFIGLSILMFLLTVCTLGFGFAWALCIELRWYAKHTKIDGRPIYFDGKGFPLLGNLIKWGFLSIVTLGVYAWWLPLKFTNWLVSHIHFS